MTSRLFPWPLVLIILAVIPRNNYGQGRAGHSLLFSTGWNHTRLLDEPLSPLVYRGGSVAFELGYQKQKANKWHQLSIQFASHGLRSDISFALGGDSHTTSLVLGQFEHRFLWDLGIKRPEKLKMYFGYQFNVSATTRELIYFQEFSEFAFEGILGVGPAISLVYLWPRKHSLALHLDLPLFSYVMTHGYNPNLFRTEMLWDADNFKLFTGFFDVGSRLDYLYVLNKRWSLKGSYLFRYYRLDRTAPIRLAFQRLYFGIILKLGKNDK